MTYMGLAEAAEAGGFRVVEFFALTDNVKLVAGDSRCETVASLFCSYSKVTRESRTFLRSPLGPFVHFGFIFCQNIPLEWKAVSRFGLFIGGGGTNHLRQGDKV